MDRHYDQNKLAAMIEKRAAEVEREAADKAAAAAARREETRRIQAEGIKREDERRAAIRAAFEQRLAAERDAATAAIRATVETDLRRSGVAEADVAARANAVMARYHEDQAFEAAARGDRAERELRDYFRSRPAPVYLEEQE